MLDTGNIHMIKQLVKGLEEHSQRSELVYQQHIDILKGRLLDRDEQIEYLVKELSQYKGSQFSWIKTEKDKKTTSRFKDSNEFDQSLRESRRSLSILFRSKLEQFEQLIGQKTTRTQGKRDSLQITQEHHKKLLMEIAHLRNDKQIYQRQLEAQAKLISQYEQQNTERVKQLKVYKQKTKQYSKNETKKIIELYTEKYKQLICNYSSFFTQLTSFIRNQLSTLKKQSMDSLGSTWEILTTSLVKFSEEMPYKSIQSRVTDQDSSILSKSQILQFQIEQLRKQLLSIKAENCVMKFQLKRKDEKRFSQAKTQPLFDKNKFFGEDTSQNDVRGSLKFQKSRKDSSRGTRRSLKQPQQEIREGMLEIKDKIRNLNNTEVGRKSSSKRKY